MRSGTDSDAARRRGTPPGLDRGPRKGMGRLFLWFVVVVNALLGAGLLVVAVGMLVGPAEDRAWSVATCVVVAVGAAGWVALGSFGFHRNYLSVPPVDGRRVTVAEVDGERAVVLPWRTTFLWQPFAVAVFIVVVMVGISAVMLADDNPGWWIAAAVVVPVALVLPDKVLQLRRRLRLVMSPTGIGVTGTDGDAWLAWDDVQGIGVEQVNQWTVIRVVGLGGAASWRYRRRPRFLYASKPGGPWVDVPGPALEIEVQALIEAIARYRRYPPARAELGGAAGRQCLVGTHAEGTVVPGV